jgi:heterodisulfide reductase subunit A
MIETGQPEVITSLKNVTMIQCVGSRDDDHEYCSRVCCTNAIKNAIRIKEISPKTVVYILYRDIRTYGLKERYYRIARDKGVIFCRYDKTEQPEVINKNDGIHVIVKDKILGHKLEFNPDMLVLSTGVVPNPQNKTLSQFLKVPLGNDGFFLEAHLKLRPVDFATDGVFVCGLAHYPKDVSETIAQARAAASRAATILSKEYLESEGRISYVRNERCSGCGACKEVCTYNAIEIDPDKHIAVVNASLCKGCGACSATCRACAIDLKGFKDEQILAALSTL